MVRSVFVDAIVLVGFGSFSYGTWLVYPPASFVLGGIVLMVAGLAAARRLGASR